MHWSMASSCNWSTRLGFVDRRRVKATGDSGLKDRVVVAGSMAQRPHWGGHTWVFLQYLLGLQRLGFDVLFLDRLTPEMLPPARGVEYVTDVMGRFGFGRDFCLLGPGDEVLAGI